MDNTLDYNSVKALAQKLGRPVSTLLALTLQHDPFYAGQAGRRRDAEWFAEIWQRFEFGAGTHLRRVPTA